MTKGGDCDEPLCDLPGDRHDRSRPTSRSRLSGDSQEAPALGANGPVGSSRWTRCSH